MFVIGVTGSLGSGKSTVAAMLKARGAQVVDADRLVHEGLKHDEKLKRAIVRGFGPEVVVKGEIDRKRLSSIVFQNQKSLRRLEGMIHPFVHRRTQEIIKAFRKKNPKGVLVLDVPLLFESKMDRLADATIVVTARQRQLLARAKARLGITSIEARKRLKRQMSLTRKAQLADYVIDNSTSLQKTQNQVNKVYLKISKNV